RWTIQPPVQEARVREADRPERHRLPVLTLARFHVPDRGHCASWPYRRGAGEGDRRGVGGAGGATAGRERGDPRAQPVRDVDGEQLESISGLANRLNLYNHYVGSPDYVQADFARYNGITPAAVQTFVRDQLKTSSRVVVHAVPGTPDFGPPVATPPAPTSAAGTGTESVNADEAWRAKPPSGGAGRTATLPTPTMATLPNGLTLLLNERRGLPIVSANLVFKTGSDANPLDKPGLASFVAAMLDEGTATRSALQIADEVAQLGASLSTASSMDSMTVSGHALSKNFGATLNLLADVALRPNFPAAEVERQRVSRLAGLLQQRENPAQVAAQVAAASLYGPKHPYGYSEIGTEASVKAMTRDDMVAFWKQNLVPNNAALVVAGEISMAELRALAEKA